MHSMKKLALLAAVLLAPFAASARSTYLSSFNSTYGTSGTNLDTCNLCHPNGTSSFNSYANDYSAANHSFRAIENNDSDRDGFTNITEINALSFPGDARSVPVVQPPAAPQIAVSNTSLSFGTVNVGSSSQQTTTVSNSGDADLTVTAARCTGTSAEFTASPASFTVAAGARQTLSITYAPTAAGADSGCIALANNAGANVNVSVSGSGQDVVAPPPSVLDVDISRFNVARRLDLSRGAVATPTVSVVNAGTVAGTATVTVESAAAGYSASQDVTLAPGATAKVKLPEFNPAGLAAGSYTFTATIADANADQDVATVVVKVIP